MSFLCYTIPKREGVIVNQPSDTIDGLFLDAENATYDAVAKRFLAHKIFLAWILKHCVSEFRDCP